MALTDESETTLKRFKRSHRRRYIKLISANKERDEMVYEASRIRIQGVVTRGRQKSALQHVPVTELCGIGDFLGAHGVHYCSDLEKLLISVLSRRFGNLGRRIWYMCQGADPDPRHPYIAASKSIGHGKVLPPNTRDRNIFLTYLQHMCSKVGSVNLARLLGCR